MALLYIMEFPNRTQQQYDQVMDRLQLGGSSPQGQLYHVAGPMEGGWCVVDVWESQEAFDRFIKERLERAMQGTGITLPEHPKVIPVHNIMEPARAGAPTGAQTRTS